MLITSKRGSGGTQRSSGMAIAAVAMVHMAHVVLVHALSLALALASLRRRRCCMRTAPHMRTCTGKREVGGAVLVRKARLQRHRSPQRSSRLGRCACGRVSQNPAVSQQRGVLRSLCHRSPQRRCVMFIIYISRSAPHSRIKTRSPSFANKSRGVH